MKGGDFNRSWARMLIHQPRKPTVPEVMPLVWAYCDRPQNATGGALHIVLDDGNVEDGHVDYCGVFALEKEDHDGELLSQILRRMSKTQRLKLGEYRYRFSTPEARAEYLTHAAATTNPENLAEGEAG